MATIKDIAQKTGLGLATISSYLNGGSVRKANKIAIEAAIEELGFEVNELARSLKTDRTKTVGVILPELDHLFSTGIISRVEDILRTHEYAAIVCDCRSDEEREADAVSFLLRKRVDGILNIPVTIGGGHLAPAEKQGKPIVLIDRPIEGLDCDCVLMDNSTAVSRATERLLNAGHSRIGFITGNPEVYTARQRYLGYCKALEQAGIEAEERLVAGGLDAACGTLGAGVIRPSQA